MHGGAFSQVARALRIMQSDYAAKIDVEQLANSARMSASAFYRAFKEITSDSLMQYLKKVRLAKAKDSIIQENMKAYIAAGKVGYESSFLFSVGRTHCFMFLNCVYQFRKVSFVVENIILYDVWNSCQFGVISTIVRTIDCPHH